MRVKDELTQLRPRDEDAKRLSRQTFHMKCGERVLLPRLREASAETLVVTAGFSCRSQIEQATNRRGLHVAQVIQLARDHGAGGPPGAFPERAAAPKPEPGPAQRARRAAVVAALAGAGALALAFSSRGS